jgi:hypothetical protein
LIHYIHERKRLIAVEKLFKRCVRKTPHTSHKGGSREVSHVQKFNKQAGWLRKNGTAAFLSRSGLK